MAFDGVPGSSDGKHSACSAGDPGPTLGLKEDTAGPVKTTPSVTSTVTFPYFTVGDSTGLWSTWDAVGLEIFTHFLL